MLTNQRFQMIRGDTLCKKLFDCEISVISVLSRMILTPIAIYQLHYLSRHLCQWLRRMCAGLFQTPNLHLAVSILFPHLYFIYNIIILDKKRRSLEETTIRALHFLKLNLRVKSSIEEKIEKQNNLPKGTMLPRKHWKPFLKRNLPCWEKQVTCQGFLRISGLIQCQPLRQEREKLMWQMKKDKNTPGKQFRGSNFNKFLNASCVHNNDEKCQLPTNTQQCFTSHKYALWNRSNNSSEV